jgi:hypothetical protein
MRGRNKLDVMHIYELYCICYCSTAMQINASSIWQQYEVYWSPWRRKVRQQSRERRGTSSPMEENRGVKQTTQNFGLLMHDEVEVR